MEDGLSALEKNANFEMLIIGFGSNVLIYVHINIYEKTNISSLP